MLNNIFVNNYASSLLGPQDVEISANQAAEIDYNVYFRHPGKDKLLRGLPYAQGVDLTPLAADNPFGLRLRLSGGESGCPRRRSLSPETLGGQVRPPLAVPRHPPAVHRAELATRAPTRTCFADFQQEDFRPRFTSPAVGHGVDLTAEVPADIERPPRSAKHPDIGPFAAPAAWWEDIDSGRATIVDGSVGLDAAGRDCGLGTAARPFATLAKAAALARWGSRIYVKDSIYRHSAVQTTFSLGPRLGAQRLPRPSPGLQPVGNDRAGPLGKAAVRGDSIASAIGTPSSVTTAARTAGRRTTTATCALGGREANATSLSRNSAELSEPFRPIRILQPGPRHAAGALRRRGLATGGRRAGIGGVPHRHR